MKLSYEIDIKAPIETVFALISDIEHLRQWLDSLEESRYLSHFDPDNPIGTPFRQRAREMGQAIEYEGKIVTYERPRRFGVRVGAKQLTLDMQYRLASIDAGTRLTCTVEMIKASFKARLLATAASSLAEKRLDTHMKKLRAVAETVA